MESMAMHLSQPSHVTDVAVSQWCFYKEHWTFLFFFSTIIILTWWCEGENYGRNIVAEAGPHS